MISSIHAASQLPGKRDPNALLHFLYQGYFAKIGLNIYDKHNKNHCTCNKIN